MAASAPSSLVSVEALAQLHALDVAARAVVDGLNAGSHRSPFKGHSVDFADHRPYVPGDDLRHLDWKVLGRRDRLVLKRYEAETDLGCSLLVDGSGSMAFQGARSAVSKYRYAAILAASLAYLVLHQQDRAGLLIFAEQEITERRPARQDQLTRICADLEAHQPRGEGTAFTALQHIGSPGYRRGLTVLFSDCLSSLDAIDAALKRLVQRGHDVALVWILDEDERDFRIADVSRFVGLEGEMEIVAEPRALAKAYRAQVEAHRLGLRRICRSLGMVLIECVTSEAPQHPLNRLLVAQQRR
ncbi:MAG: DUF58 domain-containing protein [Planctomycetota bacterium]|nr:MAG: DUF58 domain-containing protein [Planctomycetota bacterium]